MRSERQGIPIRCADESASEMTWSFLVDRRYEPVNGMGDISSPSGATCPTWLLALEQWFCYSYWRATSLNYRLEPLVPSII